MNTHYTGAKRFRSRFGGWQFAWAALLVVITVLAFGAAHAAQPVELRNRIEATGPAVTLGDLFTDAGAVSGRAVAPAPKPGQSTSFSARFLVAAASAAGLAWTPPAGMEEIVVSNGGGSVRTQLAALKTSAPRASVTGDAVIRKGDTITLSYVMPGIMLTTRAKALTDAGVGDPVRAINLQSNKTVEAIATGAGAASAHGGQSF